MISMDYKNIKTRPQNCRLLPVLGHPGLPTRLTPIVTGITATARISSVNQARIKREKTAKMTRNYAL
jgi:hypothetical protein